MFISLGRAFSDPQNSVGDAVRVFVILAGTVQMGLFIRVARRVRNTRQFGMLSLVCFGVSAIGTEVEHLGDVVTYRLLFNTAGVILACIFLYRTKREVPHDHDSDTLSSRRQ